MAYQDTLFQLGMDLTRSSPAQKEDIVVASRPAARRSQDVKSTEGRQGSRLERDALGVAGHHVLIDVLGGERLDDVAHIERALRRCADAVGRTIQHLHLHPVSSTGGVAGVAVLDDSHVSIRTWPERGFAALDVLMTGNARYSLNSRLLTEAFGASSVVTRPVVRGEAAEPEPEWTPAQAAAKGAVAIRGTKGKARVRRAA